MSDENECCHDSATDGRCDGCGVAVVATDDGFMVDVLAGTPWVAPRFTADGICRCGAPLPNRCAWHNPYGTWSHVVCAACGWEFVDEDDYLAIYTPEDLARLGQDDEDHENCTILTPEQVARQVQWHLDHPASSVPVDTPVPQDEPVPSAVCGRCGKALYDTECGWLDRSESSLCLGDTSHDPDAEPDLGAGEGGGADWSSATPVPQDDRPGEATFRQQMASVQDLERRTARFLDQTILHDPQQPDVMGNCWQTCIASLLNLPLSEVPHFVQEHESMVEVEQATRSWAALRGFAMIEIEPFQMSSPILCMLHGRSPRGVAHVVIGRGMEVLHDPHPSRAGLSSIGGAFVFVPLDPSPVPVSGERPDTDALAIAIEDLLIDHSGPGGTAALTDRILALIDAVPSPTVPQPVDVTSLPEWDALVAAAAVWPRTEITDSATATAAASLLRALAAADRRGEG